ncbi:baseplate J/gp47 family protein [Escherichia coli]|nr:baseplate J/gp47 family protein [Escherichia coli]
MALNLDTLGLSATVTAQGISAPDYQTILDTVTGYFQQIYGTDAYLDPDSKDGQMVALVALAIHDANTTAIGVYNSFSPSTALTDALTRNVKINGIARKGEARSTVDLLLTCTPGTTITNGSVKDTNGIIWNLPASVSIDVDSTVTVTAICATSGAVAAIAGSITGINTPTRGWLTVTNPLAATVGAAAETDAELRVRQGQSVALPSLTPFDAVDGALANISGVTRHKLYENDTGSVDINGLPAHSISAIVDGGDATTIAQTIRGKKGQGVATYGTTTIVVPDAWGNPHPTSFSRPVNVPIYVAITIHVFAGYTSLIGDQIKAAIADYINSLKIGDDVLLSRVYSPANLGVVSGGNSRYYDITSLQIGKSAGSVAAANIDIGYAEAASCLTANIALTVTS